MRVGVVGYGVVGRAVARFFERGPGIEIAVYDKHVAPYAGTERLEAINRCAIAFVAVPTPYDAVHGACDVGEVEDVVERVGVPICIKSTIPPGTVDALIALTGKQVAFSPEYLGESVSHPWREISDCGFLIVGGDPVACELTVRAHELVAGDALHVVRTEARCAELVKYMENTFLATKVAFVNQFFDLAAAAGVDFDELRELFLLDRRVGSSHTSVTPERGFGGKCLPKDLRAIVAWAREHGAPAPLLEAVRDYNDSIHAEAVLDLRGRLSGELIGDAPL